MGRKKKYIRIIRILKDEVDNLYRLFGENEKYAQLLQILKDYPEYEHPTQKELMKILRHQRPELMQMLNELYSNFLSEISEPDTYHISKTEVMFIVKTQDRMWDIGVNGLKHIPNV